MILTSKQRAYLRSLATAEPTIMQIGKDGIGENLVKTVSDALEARELIKLSVLDNCAWSPREAAEALCLPTRSEVVQVIGSKFVLYRRQHDASKRKIELVEDKKRKGKKA